MLQKVAMAPKVIVVVRSVKHAGVSVKCAGVSVIYASVALEFCVDDDIVRGILRCPTFLVLSTARAL